MILHGVGIDVVDIMRFMRLVDTHGDRFTERWFTQRERLDCARLPQPPRAFAARFALKEAVWKSIGSADGSGRIPWQGITVTTDEWSRTWSADLSGYAAESADAMSVASIQSTVMVEGAIAIAVAHSYRMPSRVQHPAEHGDAR